MFDNLFGAEMPLAVRFFLAFLIVLGLIGGAAWAVRRFGTGRLGGANARGRQPRLAVIDYASVDGRRRLILVRRDNVEHLLMIGGPTDLVVEPNIVRAVAAPRDTPALRAGSGLDTLPRAIPLPENGTNGNGWPLQPEPVAALRPSPRLDPLPDELPSRPSPAETPPRPQRDTLAALADELSIRPAPLPPRSRAATMARAAVLEPRRETPVEPHAESEAAPEPRQETRQETRPETHQEPEPRQPPTQPAATAPSAPVPPPVATETAAAADQSLADMAQRLEAALRKSSTPPAMPPRPPRPSEPRPARAEAKPSQGKSALYDNLEQEMASLLGRPPKT
jgi:hypothetical protein